MTTATQVIDHALSILGVRYAGQALDGEQLTDLLYRLNSIVDLWRTESLYSYASQAVTVNLPGGTQSLTIGPTGNIVTNYRPVGIGEGSFFTSGGTDYPMSVLDSASFDKISYKGQSGLGPSAVFYKPTLPNGTLYFYPQASGGVSLSLNVQQQMLQFADFTTSYTLSPGYASALSYTLAEELSSDYHTQLSPTAAKKAMMARRAIKRLNHTTPMLGDSFGVSENTGIFNAPTDTLDGGSL